MKGRIFGFEAHGPLVEALCVPLDLQPGEAVLGGFADGERHVRLTDEVAGSPVVLVGSTGPPVDSNLMTLALLADATRRAGAWPIVAIVPYFGYSRSERMAEPGTPIGARVAADLLLAAGIGRLITVDLHSPAIPGFFTVPVFEESAMPLLAEAFRAGSSERVVVSPDAGGIKRASHVASLLGVPLAAAVKHRPVPDAPKVTHLWGEVAGREALIVDDMITTGATLEAVAGLLRERGVTAIDVAATHAVMAADARERLRKAGIRRLVTTDSIPHAHPDWEVVAIAPLLARAIRKALGGAPW